jgi:hypothetical protein
MNQDQDSQNKPTALIMERLTPLESLDRSFDVEFWQRQSATARFSAAWEMVVFAHQLKGRDATELRLQRTVEALHPTAG